MALTERFNHWLQLSSLRLTRQTEHWAEECGCDGYLYNKPYHIPRRHNINKVPDNGDDCTHHPTALQISCHFWVPTSRLPDWQAGH